MSVVEVREGVGKGVRGLGKCEETCQVSVGETCWVSGGSVGRSVG